MANKERRKKIYVLLLSSNDPVGYAIRKITKAPYNHSVLAMDSSLTELYTFDMDIRLKNKRPYLRNGLVHEELSNFRDRTSYWLYSINTTDKQYAQIRKTIEMLNQQKTSYNIKGALGFIFPPAWRNINRSKYSFTCSEFIAYCLQNSGVTTFDKPLYSVTPGDLARMKEVTFIKQGRIGELKNKSILYSPVLAFYRYN